LFRNLVVPILPATATVVTESGEKATPTPDTSSPAETEVRTVSETLLSVLKLTTDDSFPPYLAGNPPFITSTSETMKGSIAEISPEK